MRAIRSLLSWLRSLVRRERVEQEIDAELQFHLEQEAAERVAAGQRGRGAGGGPARARQRRLCERRMPRFAGAASRRRVATGPAPHRPDAPPSARLRAGRHPLPGARHRRQHRRLPADQLRPAAHAASAQPRGDRLRTRRRRASRARFVERIQFGSHVRPLGADPQKPGGVLRRVRLGRRAVAAWFWRGCRNDRRSLGQRRVVLRAEAVTRPRPAVVYGRRSTRLRNWRSRSRLLVLAAPLRRRRGDRRQDALAHRPPGDHHRRGAERLLRARGREEFRCRAAYLRGGRLGNNPPIAAMSGGSPSWAG